MRRPTYTAMCRVSAWLFLLSAIGFLLGLGAAHDRGDVVGCIAGMTLSAIGASCAASSARRGS
jgi:hypothetical protein